MITLYNKSNFPFPSPKISRILQLRLTLHGKDMVHGTDKPIMDKMYFTLGQSLVF